MRPHISVACCICFCSCFCFSFSYFFYVHQRKFISDKIRQDEGCITMEILNMKSITTKFPATTTAHCGNSNNKLFILVMNKREPCSLSLVLTLSPRTHCLFVPLCVPMCAVYSCAWAFKQRISSNSMVCILCSQNYQLSHMHDFSIEKCQSVDLPLLFMYENIF